MVGPELVSDVVAAGADLVRALDAAGLAVDTAAWIYYPDAETWRLMLYIPGSRGQLETLLAIAKVIAEQPDIAEHMSIIDVSWAPADDRVLAAIKSRVQTGTDIGRYRLRSAFANGVFIEAALVYRALDMTVPAIE